MDIALYILIAALAGALVAWFVASMRYQRRCSSLEIRATSAETLVGEKIIRLSKKSPNSRTSVKS